MHFLLIASFAVLIFTSLVFLKPGFFLAPKDEVSKTPTPPLVTPQTETPAPDTLYAFQYPNSRQTETRENALTFESTDSPQFITDWYKEKIKAEGLNTTSFIQTNTNGNVLNKLAGANGSREIQVEITKKSDSPKVTITLTND